MGETQLGFSSTGWIVLVLMSFLAFFVSVECQTGDASVMQELKKNLNPPSSLGWVDSDPCNWQHLQCDKQGRVIRIQIGNQGLSGSLPTSLNKLMNLQILEVQWNQLTGPLPSLSGLGSLQRILLNNNNFTSIPSDFFKGMTSLQAVYLDYNPFSSWVIPDSLKDASALNTFSATSANISGTIPEFLSSSSFSGLTTLHLSFNSLEGGLPSTFSGSQIQSLWLNGQSSSKLNGSIAVIQNMTELSEIWLHGNLFTGPLPDFSGLTQLQNFSVRDNSLTGPVPNSLRQLPSLVTVNLTNNLLQGPMPKFKDSVKVDNSGVNSFCLNTPGTPCDSRVNNLLAVVQSVGYPSLFASNWKGNDPCSSWLGITCDKGNITVVNFQNMKLAGTISPSFSSITSLQKLILAKNMLSGTIPVELTTLPNLQLLDVSNNQLYGKIPPFKNNIIVKTDGNVNIGKDTPPPTGTPPGTNPDSPGPHGKGSGKTSSTDGKKTGVIVGSVVGGVGAAVVCASLVVFCLCRAKRKRAGPTQVPSTTVIHPRHSGSDQDTVKITITGSNANGGASETYSVGSSGNRDIHIVEAGNMVISIQVLKNVTNNFSEENILGRGGFGIVYKGELHDGTKIAVKRMESGIMTEKGSDEFKSEIAVLTKVRHRHLVALLGYCLDGNEKILVYEYMPQGALSRYLFNWKQEDLKPLEWMKRLTIALDVARGVEYLHSLAQHSFIHRDLKPSNILLGDDLRAKVSDFGLVRLVPDGKATVVTKLAGTFGYLAPEYAGSSFVSHSLPCHVVALTYFPHLLSIHMLSLFKSAFFNVNVMKKDYVVARH